MKHLNVAVYMLCVVYICVVYIRVCMCIWLTVVIRVREEEKGVIARMEKPNDFRAGILDKIAITDRSPRFVCGIRVHEFGWRPRLALVEGSSLDQIDVAVVITTVLACFYHREQRS